MAAFGAEPGAPTPPPPVASRGAASDAVRAMAETGPRRGAIPHTSQ